MNNLKNCTKCKQNQEFIQFRKDKTRTDGLYPHCKTCCREYKKKYDLKNYEKHKTYRFENKEFKSTYDKLYRNKNIEKLAFYEQNRKQQKSTYNLEYARKNPGKMNARTAKRNAAKLLATPKWLSLEHHKKIEEIYSQAFNITKETGIDHHVDHIIPLQGRNVRGLHVPWNLQIITAKENVRKSNKDIN